MQTYLTKWLIPAGSAAVDQSSQRSTRTDPHHVRQNASTANGQLKSVLSPQNEQDCIDDDRSSDFDVNESCNPRIEQPTLPPVDAPSQDGRPISPNLRPLPRTVTLQRCTKQNMDSFKRLSSLLPLSYPDRFYAEILSDSVVADLTLLAVANESVSAAIDGPRSASTQAPEFASATKSKSTPAPAPVSASTSASVSPSPRVVAGIRCRLLDTPPADRSNKHTRPHCDRIHNPRPTLSHSHNHNPTVEPNQSAPSQDRILYVSTLITQPSYRNLGLASILLSTVTQTAIATYGTRKVVAHVWSANVDAREWYSRHGFVEVRLERGYYRRLVPTDAVVVEKTVGVLT